MEIAIAAIAAVAFAVLSLLVGDRFPFSKHSMYASTAARGKTGAVPLFLAHGKPAPIDQYHRFLGLDPDNLYNKDLPCSLEWQTHEAGRWIRDKSDPPDAEPGPVPVAWGYVIIRVQDDDTLKETWLQKQTGTAWPR